MSSDEESSGETELGWLLNTGRTMVNLAERLRDQN